MLGNSPTKQHTEREEGLYDIWPVPLAKETERKRTNSASKREEKSKDHSSKRNKTKQSKSIQQESGQRNKTQSLQSPSHENQSSLDIEVSIIIPSSNKYPLNLLSLFSLENQTFNQAKMEVIFIDDASTDQTAETLNSYSPPYQFIYIRSKEKLGRAKSRNLGIRSARGSILIFLDAEMITEANFVENHYKSHQSKENMILSGAMHSKALYSCVFPEFSEKQINKIGALTKNNQEINKRFQVFNYPSEELFPLVEKSDITSGSFRRIAFKAYPWFQEITKNFDDDLQGFAFPWMAFLTGNVSIRKAFIVQAGGFDEDFFHYGYEDWELGYRLYQMGADYHVSSAVITYHQEHPVGESKWQEAVGNFGLFTIKHHDVDVLILGLELSRLTDLLTMNKILIEYKLLVQSNLEQIPQFQEKFLYILETITLMLVVDIRHINILGAAGYGSDDRKALQEDINQIKNLNKYKHLTIFLEKIIIS
ncbi:hypothetical protein BACCIP111895_02835 [Neobacillus rhizosphaerae]|uniref:Glycosyltransferase 2-like domain-containing protein n=1 Tax=Neobacillus rhizosphaerae TaxID=2880965 RepID=A0ABN8KPU5_9BACI|nr:glycosyltransferase [Neobacillus rhizosphaerae]CAH2715651.1 hypothetical protein BACCIP111895_02835 [Neobacillus rhizosphaerae]